jgi:hypothetical protein
MEELSAQDEEGTGLTREEMMSVRQKVEENFKNR